GTLDFFLFQDWDCTRAMGFPSQLSKHACMYILVDSLTVGRIFTLVNNFGVTVLLVCLKPATMITRDQTDISLTMQPSTRMTYCTNE
uniref:Uncharacterized protein n=1 Tax=Aegilops tauschii subsp. strangulata TaxID=200361 RepID=A0A452ZDH4_AEGTS